MIATADAVVTRLREHARDQWEDPDGPHNLTRRATPRETLAALGLFAALAVLHTWPLAAGLNTLSRHDIADAMLNEWAVAWVAHTLPRDPLHLFDANIFYPEPNTLAFSEHMFVQGVMGAPLLWLGVPTLVVHNLLVLAGLALTGWTMALVMRRRTGSWACGILGGMLLAFNAHTLSRLAHLQAVHVEFLPLALFALDRLLTRPRAVNALRLAAAYVLQGLTSNYFLVFMTFGLAGAGIVRWREWIGRGRLRVLGLVCLAGLAAVLVLAPFLIPYLQAQRDQGLTRSLDEVAKYAASWRDYLSATGTLHFRLWSGGLWRGFGAPLFPGLVGLVLTVVAVASGLAWRHRAARMWFAMGIVGLVLSFGAALPGYSVLYHAVPLLQGIRASVRFGFLALAGVAALASFGLMILRLKFAASPALKHGLTAAAMILVTLEALRVPVPYSPPYRPSAAYEVLRDEPGAVLLELPLPPPAGFQANAPYLLNATRHWRPILNGYSGFLPRSYYVHRQHLATFPDDRSIEYLRRLGVTHVAVQGAQFPGSSLERIDAIARSPALQAAISSPELTIYKIRTIPR
jgi:hypothetical protein